MGDATSSENEKDLTNLPVFFLNFLRTFPDSLQVFLKFSGFFPFIFPEFTIIKKLLQESIFPASPNSQTYLKWEDYKTTPPRLRISRKTLIVPR